MRVCSLAHALCYVSLSHVKHTLFTPTVGPTGNATAFSPSSVVPNQSTAALVTLGATVTAITVSGTLLASTDAVLFEPTNPTCNPLGTTPLSVLAASVTPAAGSTVVVALPGGGLPGGLFSVCIRFSASGSYFKVGSAQLLVRCVRPTSQRARLAISCRQSLTVCLPALTAADVVSGASSVAAELPSATVSIVGVALDSPVTVNSVRFEPGAVCNSSPPSGPVTAATTVVSNMTRTQLTATMGGSGLLLATAGPDNFSTCVEYTARLGFFYRVATTLVGGTRFPSYPLRLSVTGC